MFNTPKANRLHISILGKSNAGRSSLINALLINLYLLYLKLKHLELLQILDEIKFLIDLVAF